MLSSPASALSLAKEDRTCAKSEGSPLGLNQIIEVTKESQGIFLINLDAGQGIIVDLVDPLGLSALAVEGIPATSASVEVDLASTGDGDMLAVDAAADAGSVFDMAIVQKPRIRICRSKDLEQLAPGQSDVVFDDLNGDVQTTLDGDRLVFVAPTTATYVVDVAHALNSRKSDASQPMEIFARNRPIPRAAGVRKLDDQKLLVGDGQWTVSDNFDGNFYGPIFSFDGQVGQLLTLIVMDKKGGQFDPFLRLASPSTRSSGELMIADDGVGDDKGSAKIEQTLTETGRYRVQVGGFGSAGEFELRLAIGTPPPIVREKLKLGSQTSGILEGTKQYEFSVRKGREYLVSVKHTAYPDILLGIELSVTNPVIATSGGALAASEFSIIAIGEVIGDGSSTFRFKAAEDRTMFVRPSSYDFTVSTGDYALVVAEAR